MAPCRRLQTTVSRKPWASVNGVTGSGVFTQYGGTNIPYVANLQVGGVSSNWFNSLQLGTANGSYGEYDMYLDASGNAPTLTPNAIFVGGCRQAAYSSGFGSAGWSTATCGTGVFNQTAGTIGALVPPIFPRDRITPLVSMWAAPSWSAALTPTPWRTNLIRPREPSP